MAGIAQTGMTASFETTPIVVNGVMYITTPTVDNKMKMMALDATNGRAIWETTYSLGPFQICCGPVNRGPAVGYGMVYVLTLDDKLLALDATTGKVRWAATRRRPDGRLFGNDDAAGLRRHGHRRQRGRRVADPRLRRRVQRAQRQAAVALRHDRSRDVRRHFVAARRRDGLDDARRRSKLGLLIFSTGNPNPDLEGKVRVGDNHWSDSIVAIDVHTGKFKWGYQEVKHDVWDYDAVSPPVLFDVQVNGQTVPAAGEAGKVGWFYIVDRRNGKLIRRSDAVRRDDEEHVQPADRQGRRDAARRERRRRMVAAGVLAGHALRVRARRWTS